ncbi:helix-turn-helix transcriptional regulator [Allorhizobium pseudoryzae]|uniref:helix-turn-helix transcriptional regulator n=1 Tax=Allorhizobium pseudoryzae TaxID=379684 RepID=UPI003CFC8BBC
MDLRSSLKKKFSLHDAISDIRRMDTQFDILRLMRSVAEEYGFRYFVVFTLPPRTVLDLAASTIVTNLPAEFIALFDKYKLLQSSPLLHRLRETTLPICYEIEKEPSLPHALDVFAQFSLTGGIAIPVHDVRGKRGVVGFLGSRPPLVPQEVMELAHLAAHVYEKLSSICAIDVRTTEALSERELDCLNWTAAGKTSAEIAEILNLSEHTVNHYLNRATRKLDAVNRTQAVAKGFRLGLVK